MKKIWTLIFLLPVYVQAQQKIGIEFYTFRNQFAKDVEGTLQTINKMGFTEAEGGGSYNLTPQDFKKMLDKYKISVISIGVDFNQLDSNLDKIIQSAKLYGSKYVVCFWIPHNGTDFTFADASKAVAVFNKAGKTLKESGLLFCYHPHGYEFRPYNNETLFDYMMKNTDPRYVNYEMDVFWVKHPGQDPVALLKKYPGRFKLMHLKDRMPGTEGNQNGEADVESNVVLGSGDVGIADIMRVAKQYGVEHYFIEDESSRSVEQVPQSLIFLKGIK